MLTRPVTVPNQALVTQETQEHEIAHPNRESAPMKPISAQSVLLVGWLCSLDTQKMQEHPSSNCKLSGFKYYSLILLEP